MVDYLHIHYGGVFWDVVLNRARQDWALEILQSFITQLYSVKIGDFLRIMSSGPLQKW